MKLKKLLIGIAIVSVTMPTAAFATSDNGNQAGQANQGTTSDSTGSSSQSQTQSQTETQAETQIQTNNPGTGAMTQEQTRTELQTELQKSEPTYTPTKTQSQTRLNSVSDAIKNILTIASRVATQNTALSDQIQTAAQEQIQAQDRTNQALDKAESRTGFAKFFIGPNYKQLKTAKQEMEQNRLRIQELNQIIAQISNTSDQTELQNQILILEEQNTNLEEQLNQDTKGFALFGWFSRLINSY